MHRRLIREVRVGLIVVGGGMAAERRVEGRLMRRQPQKEAGVFEHSGRIHLLLVGGCG